MPAEDFKETVKQQADIVRIIGDYIKLKKAGAQNYSGLCPFHGEKTPSFSVHATRQFYHCFGCGVSGDVFSFVQKIENITFPEAVRLVAQKLGIALPKATYSSPGEAQGRQAAGAVARCSGARRRIFPGMPEASRRSAGPRISGGARAGSRRRSARFRIGYAPDSGFLLRDRLAGEFSEEVLRESGLFSWKQEDSLSRQHQPQQTQSVALRANSRFLAGLRPLGMTKLKARAVGRTTERPKPSRCTPNSATASCSPSPTTRAKSLPSPDEPSRPTKKPGRNI